MDELARLLELQSGVVSRRQAGDCGLQPHDIRRLLRRRELVQVHPGVMIDHTGPLTWLQRAWAATLAVSPAALCNESALRAADGPGRREYDDGSPIHVAVDRHRNLLAPDGVKTHRMAHLDDRILWNASPPRMRYEEAVLDVAAGAPDDYAAIQVLAQAVQARRTTPDRLIAALAGRERITRRDFLSRVLGDIREGACSVLEHGYLTLVERPHGLPRADRQVRASSRGPTYRDVEYPTFRTVVELDSRLFHDSAAARDRDLDRDLDPAVTARLRSGWAGAKCSAPAAKPRPGSGCCCRPAAGPALRSRALVALRGGSVPLGDTTPPHTPRGAGQRVAHPSSSPARQRPSGSSRRPLAEVFSCGSVGLSRWSGPAASGRRRRPWSRAG